MERKFCSELLTTFVARILVWIQGPNMEVGSNSQFKIVRKRSAKAHCFLAEPEKNRFPESTLEVLASSTAYSSNFKLHVGMLGASVVLCFWRVLKVHNFLGSSGVWRQKLSQNSTLFEITNMPKLNQKLLWKPTEIDEALIKSPLYSSAINSLFDEGFN